tara:strand:+ start:211 stop:918 length:708 start_codon:yes stop_codon:yes gene_type:complete
MKKILKKSIKSLLNKTNWRLKKIYRNKSYTNIKPRKELLNAMHDCNGIIHMGAHRGGEAPIYDWFNKKAIWIEANPEVILDLKENVTQFINQKVIQALLSNKDDKMVSFKISSNDGASSSIFSFGSYNEIHKNIKMVKTINLKTVKFDTVVKNNKININEYNFWTIDLQGSELLALEGAKESLINCKFIYVEVSKKEIYEGGAKWDDLNDYLLKNNFYLAWEPKETHTDVLYIKK